MRVVKHLSFKPRRLALAMAQATLLALACSPGQAGVQLTGPYWLDPGNPTPIGPGNVNLPGSLLYVGAGGNGSFQVLSGSSATLASLRVGAGNGQGDVLLDGAGSSLQLLSDGNSSRLEIGHYGLGTLTVSNGATLDAGGNQAACSVGNRDCSTRIGNTAGSSGSLIITGLGSTALLAGNFTVATTYAQPNFGTPGQDSHGSAQVLNGARLATGAAAVGGGWYGPSSTGNERSFADVLVQGSGSRWEVSGVPFSPYPQAHLDIGVGQHSVGKLQVLDGAVVTVADGGYSNIGTSSSQGSLLLQRGGAIDYGSSGVLSVGSGGQGSVLVDSQAQLTAGRLVIGDNGSGVGQMTIGAGGTVVLNSVGMGRLMLGHDGNGELRIEQGGLLLADANAQACQGQWCGSNIGSAAGSTGLLTIDGAGSRASFIGHLHLAQLDVARPPFNAWTFGQPGGVSNARLIISNGGVLDTDGMFLATGRITPAGTGGERANATVVIQGSGSQLNIHGQAGDGSATLGSGGRSGNQGDLQIVAGGQMLLQSSAQGHADFTLNWGGGNSTVLIDGVGSTLTIAGGADSFLGIANGGGNSLLTLSHGAALAMSGDFVRAGIGGRGGPAFDQLGQGRVQLLSGAQWTGAQWLWLGSQGAQGSMLVADAGTRLTLAHHAGDPGSALLDVGWQGQGQLEVRDGALAQAGWLQLGGASSGGWADVLIGGRQNGQAARVELDALGFHRLGLEHGQLTVANGGVLDARVNAAACLNNWCGAFLGNNAGADARFTITGAGSQASFLSGFNIGGSYVTAPPATPYSLGEVGGHSHVDLRVLNGGLLQTESVRIGTGSSGAAADGSETVNVNVRLDGPGSRWLIQGGATASGAAATLHTGINGDKGSADNVQVGIQIRNGAQLLFSTDGSSANQLMLARDGGQTSMLVTGAGSTLGFSDALNSGIWVGRNGGQASLSFADGAQLQGVNRLQVGNAGGSGLFNMDGTATRAFFDPQFADVYIGRIGGQGQVNIRGGAQMILDSTRQAYLSVGDDVDATGRMSQGALRLDGAGTLLSMHTTGSSGDGINPLALIGQNGYGSLTISSGAQLRMEGERQSNASDDFFTWMTVGNGSGAQAVGTALITGANSELRQEGFNRALAIGRWAQGSGSMTVSNQGLVSSTAMMVGKDGGRGQLKVDNAVIALSGQWLPGASTPATGAGLAIGAGAGSQGVVSLDHGATLTISNIGSEGTHLTLGGNKRQSQGSGILDLAGGSTIVMNAAPGQSAVVIGYDGSGIATLRGGSALLASDGRLLIARMPTGIGQLKLSEGSFAQAAYVGVGAVSGADAGVATLIVNDSSVLNASTIEVGRHGYVGGTGTLIGNVINRGVFSPGNSPGTLHIQGSFQNQQGGRLVLEVQSDGHGGFVTDQLLFADGATVSLDQLQLSFHFLGNTDPNAFQASGLFGVNTFLQQGGHALDAGLFNQVSYTASADAYQINGFSFSASGGAVFSAQPVPEPATWAMLMTGILLMGWRRRAAQRERD